jgi:hypothetical protein
MGEFLGECVFCYDQGYKRLWIRRLLTKTLRKNARRIVSASLVFFNPMRVLVITIARAGMARAGWKIAMDPE